MLSDMLKLENIQVVDHIDAWQDAIHVCLKPLEDGGYVEPRYAEAIIETTKELGPYYVIGEDIALVHARAEQGVLKRQLSVALVKKPVQFPEDSFPVRILIGLAATDPNSHLDIMQLLVSIFVDEEKVQDMIACNSPEEIYNFFLTEAQSIEQKE